MASPSQDQRNLDETPTVKEMMHKTKIIQFFGRTTPIILQNDNGPCPLLAICNILLLRNNLSLSSDVAEVSQEKLLSLVAERLIDSNSNVNNKDAGYVENQQQNIADAIDLLPRLATGIDVNIKFRRIDDFEFTRECAIFDLLDIPLCHGWLVDPQDSDTSNAIGSKSYNTLMGELVALDTQTMESFSKNNSEEDYVDNVALTTTNLEVLSSLSRGSLHPVTDETETDLEKETKLSVALKLSKTVGPTMENDLNVVGTTEETISTNSEVDKSSIRNTCNDDLITFDTKVPGEDVCSSLEVDKESRDGQINTTSESEKHESKDGIEKTEVWRKTENVSMSLSGSDSSSLVDIHVHKSGGDEKIPDQTTSNNLDINDVEKKIIDEKTSYESCSSAPNTVLESSKGTTETIVESNSTNDGNEPIYGEKHISKMSTTANEVQEPIYEAEAEDSISISADNTRPRPGTTARQGELIRTFLKNSASQLTIYGLFSLQDGLKERELCVFFRNNHFNTMFKFEGELYILATDQGYLNQPDLVWEKLNEVNGDTVFVDSNFKKFIAENHETRSWDVQNAMANTAEYLARIDNTAQGNTSFNSDLQLAIALQQQEFEQQQQQQPQPRPQSPTTSRSGLVVGPQHVHPSRPRNSSSSSRQETKPSKEKCTVM